MKKKKQKKINWKTYKCLLIKKEIHWWKAPNIYYLDFSCTKATSLLNCKVFLLSPTITVEWTQIFKPYDPIIKCFFIFPYLLFIIKTFKALLFQIKQHIVSFSYFSCIVQRHTHIYINYTMSNLYLVRQQFSRGLVYMIGPFMLHVGFISC